MFEFHGWVSISESTCEQEDDDEALKKCLATIKSTLDEIDDSFSKVDLVEINGCNFLTMHGFRNHTQLWVYELFEYAGFAAKGSYGVLYVRDDEDVHFDNEMQVWSMVRGKIQKQKDGFLSPCIPLLEQ